MNFEQIKRFFDLKGNFHYVALMFGAICTLLFVLLSEGNLYFYNSDIYSHIEITLYPEKYEAGRYSLLHHLLISIPEIFNFPEEVYNRVISAFMPILLGISIYLSSYFVMDYFKNKYPNSYDWLNVFLSLSLFFVSMVIMDQEEPLLYLGNWTPNPWHNPTYIFSRVFAILLFVYSLRIIEKQQFSFSNLIKISFLGILTMWAKPSFLLSFIPAIGLLTFIQFTLKKIALRDLVKLFIAFVPSLLVLFFINKSVYTSELQNSNQVVVNAGIVWGEFSKDIFRSFLLGMMFPLYVVIIRLRQLTSIMLIALINWIFAFLIFYFLAESGNRMEHANFAWTYMFGMFFMFFASIETMFFKRTNSNIIELIVGILLFVAHVWSGIIYFSKIFMGLSYL